MPGRAVLRPRELRRPLPADGADERAARREGASRRALPRLGWRPADGGEARRFLFGHLRDRGEEAARIGVHRVREERIDRRVLDHRAGIEDDDAVGEAGEEGEVVGDPDDRHAEALAERLHEVDDLRLDGDVEGGGRLVGDEELRVAGEAHGDHHPLAHAAGELVRIGVEALLGSGDADQTQELDRPRMRRLAGEAAVIGERLGELGSDPHHRVQRRHRVLEDEADLAAADVAEAARRHGEEVLSVEGDAARRDPDLVREEADDAEHGQALAAAALADDAERLAAVDMEVDAVDHGRRAAPGGDLDRESADVEEPVAHFTPRGLSASLRPSPRNEKPTVARPRTRAGAARRCG